MSEQEVKLSYDEVQRAQRVWETHFEIGSDEIWKFLKIPKGTWYTPTDHVYTLPAHLAHKIKLLAGPYGAAMLKALLVLEKSDG